MWRLHFNQHSVVVPKFWDHKILRYRNSEKHNITKDAYLYYKEKNVASGKMTNTRAKKSQQRKYLNENWEISSGD